MSDAPETVITWSVQNWITVVLMVVVGFAIYGVATSAIKRKRA